MNQSQIMISISEIKKIQRAIRAEDEGLPIIFGALGDARRFKIFNLLCEYRDLCVTDIAKIFGISVPAASQQLKILEMTGLIKGVRAGQSMCYTIRTNSAVRALLRGMKNKEKVD
ncbi:MAG: metalloregulator ArsR/SmtB family transcription factor [Candidatus Liptonbacteria bacterium]